MLCTYLKKKIRTATNYDFKKPQYKSFHTALSSAVHGRAEAALCYRSRVPFFLTAPHFDFAPGVCQQRSRVENVGGSSAGSKFVFQLRSAPAAQTGSRMMLCNLSLAEGDLGSLQETNTFPHPSHGPAICASESLRTTLQVNVHRVTRTEMHTDNTLGSSSPLFLRFLNNPITPPQFTKRSQENNGEALLRGRSSPCMPYLSQPRLFVASAAGRWVQKVEKVGAKGALGSAITQQFQH